MEKSKWPRAIAPSPIFYLQLLLATHAPKQQPANRSLPPTAQSSPAHRQNPNHRPHCSPWLSHQTRTLRKMDTYFLLFSSSYKKSVNRNKFIFRRPIFITKLFPLFSRNIYIQIFLAIKSGCIFLSVQKTKKVLKRL